MKNIIYSIKDWYIFGKDQGFIFALKYKLGIAKEGIDFIDAPEEANIELKEQPTINQL